MDTAVYTALSKEVGIFRDMEVTANNIANMTTTGFQGESVLFDEYLVNSTRQEGKLALANDVASYRSTEQGTFETTGSALDAAIQGKGYFVIQTPLGPRYTRNGNFKVNAVGALVTSEGYPVLDDASQPITFDENDRVVTIRDDGTVNVDAADRARINVVQFANEQLLERVGNTMYKSDAKPIPAQDFTVANGVLERANVQPVTQLTHMMYISRSITDTANFINAIYTLERKASDTFAKIYS